MRNYNTYLQIGHFFDQPDNFAVNNSVIEVSINGHFVIKVGQFVNICQYETNIDKRVSFRSVMKDCETIDPFTANSFVINQGYGIGVIMDFSRDFYLKLYYHDVGPPGTIGVVFASIIGDILKAKRILSHDLGLGYDVYIIDYKEKSHQLCEKKR